MSKPSIEGTGALFQIDEPSAPQASRRMSGSPFSMPRARAGAPSVIRLSQSNCTAARTGGQPAIVPMNNTRISATLQDSK